MIDYHKYVGYCWPDEKEKNRWEGGGGRWDEEKPVESGGDYSTNSSIRSRDSINPREDIGDWCLLSFSTFPIFFCQHISTFVAP